MAEAKNITDKQVESARKRVDTLREKIDAERLTQSVVVSTSENDIQLAALDAEEVRLKTELDAVRAAGKDQKKVIGQQVEAIASPAGPDTTNEGIK